MTSKKTVEVNFSIDDLKAIKIASRLFNQFYNQLGFFKNYSMPEYVLPRNLKEGSREHALFLTRTREILDWMWLARLADSKSSFLIDLLQFFW